MKNLKFLVINTFFLSIVLLLTESSTYASLDAFLVDKTKCNLNTPDLCSADIFTNSNFDVIGKRCIQCNTGKLGKCLPAGDNYTTCQTDEQWAQSSLR